MIRLPVGDDAEVESNWPKSPVAFDFTRSRAAVVLVWFGCLPRYQSIEPAGPAVRGFRAKEGATTEGVHGCFWCDANTILASRRSSGGLGKVGISHGIASRTLSVFGGTASAGGERVSIREPANRSPNAVAWRRASVLPLWLRLRERRVADAITDSWSSSNWADAAPPRGRLPHS